MKILLDTHSIIWWLTDDARLSSEAKGAIRDIENEVFVSAASAWEISNKVRLGKWPEARELATGLREIMLVQRFVELPITITHGQTAGLLPGRHRDPFDRILAAQSIAEGMPVVTADAVFAEFGAKILW